ncbi:MAG TPA: hypothetical protein VGN97_21865 [Mesorhizobium sp.]|jgi:hypothetical protein|nr:hypothetical protein [Mesorhizobium sp.]
MAFVPAAIAAVGTAVAGISTWLGSSAIGAALLQVGLGVAAKYLAAKFQKKPPAQAVQLETRYGEDLARSVLMGTTATGGHHIYRNAYTKGNRRIQDVYVLSHFRITDVSRIRVEGEWRALAASDTGELGRKVLGIDADIWVKVHHGTMGQAADPNLVEEANPPGRWTVDHRLAGVAYAVVTQQLDKEKLPQPLAPLFEVQGAPLYDWRKDSTVGGTGLHRWNDQATWQYSDNPALMAYALERGFFNGTELMVGKAVTHLRLPLSEWTLAANICDELVDGTKRYRAALLAVAGQGSTHSGNMEPLLEAFAASWFEGPAGEFPIAGANQATAATFTDADLYAEKDRRFSRFRPRDQLVNFVAGTYPDPDSFYETVPFAPRLDEAALAADRERLAVSIPFEAVPYRECVDRLADIALRASRYQANGEVCLHPKFLRLKPGQWVRWSSARHGDRRYQVVSKRLGPIGPDAPRAVYLTLQEVGDGIFDPTAYVTNPPVVLPPGTPDYQAELVNYLLIPLVVEPKPGARRPGVRAQWAPIEDVTIASIEWEYRPVAQPAAVLRATVGADATLKLISEGLTSLSDWEFRYRLVADPPRTIPWTAWVPVTTADARFGPADLSPIGTAQLEQAVQELLTSLEQGVIVNATAIQQEVQARQTAILGEADARVAAVQAEASARLADVADLSGRFRTTFDQLNQIALVLTEQDFANYLDVQQLRREMVVRDGTTRAAYTEAITVATGPDSAIATRLTVLEVSTTNLGAAVSVEQQARVDGDQALATQIALLSAGSQEQFDWANIWLFDSTAEGWTGNPGIPTVASGFLVPPTGSDPNVLSPAGLAIDGSAYSQVRLRIRKVGSPAWEGALAWGTPANPSREAPRQVTIAEPAFDAGGFATLLFTPAWAGSTIDGIRLDLSTTADASNHYTVDWIAIGRPSPGASQAALAAEQTVRAQQYSALASDITALQVTVNGINGTVGGHVTAISELQGSVAVVQGQVAVHGGRLDAIETQIPGFAQASAVSALEAEVQSLTGGGLLAQAQAIVALRGELDGLALLVSEQDYANLLDRDRALRASADAYQTLNFSLSQVDGRVTAAAEAVTRVQAQLGGYATVEAFSALSVRVTAAEGSITSQASAITGINLALDGKATVSAVNALTGRMTQAEGVNTYQAQALTSLETLIYDPAIGLGARASATALNALDNQVQVINGQVSAQAGAITSIQSAINDPATGLASRASASAVNSLTTRVSETEGVNASQATALTQVQARVGEVGAEGNLRFVTTAGSGGFSSDILLQARVGSAGNWRQSAMRMRVPSDPNAMTQVAFVADQFLIVNEVNVSQPFVFQGGVLSLAVANIGEVSSGLLRSPDNRFRMNLSAGTLEIFF